MNQLQEIMAHLSIANEAAIKAMHDVGLSSDEILNRLQSQAQCNHGLLTGTNSPLRME